MPSYPNTLSSNVTFLQPGVGLGERADDALNALYQKGFAASVGLTALHVPRIYEMSQEPAIVEFCPKDQKTRFHPNVVADWIGKGSEGLQPGRGFVAIHDVRGDNGAALSGADVDNLTDADVEPIVYGWSGWEKNNHLPGQDVTTAYRVSKKGSYLARERRSDGELFGLGGPITELVLATGVHLYSAPADRISLETWRSNKRARGLYERAGFERVLTADVFEEDGRPTLHEIGEMVNGHVVFGKSGNNTVQDTRLNYFLAEHPLLESK